jgi:hypothetical protein
MPVHHRKDRAYGSESAFEHDFKRGQGHDTECADGSGYQSTGYQYNLPEEAE